jgi:hypothetical protein
MKKLLFGIIFILLGLSVEAQFKPRTTYIHKYENNTKWIKIQIDKDNDGNIFVGRAFSELSNPIGNTGDRYYPGKIVNWSEQEMTVQYNREEYKYNHLLKLNGNQLIDINQATGETTVFIKLNTIAELKPRTTYIHNYENSTEWRKIQINQDSYGNIFVGSAESALSNLFGSTGDRYYPVEIVNFGEQEMIVQYDTDQSPKTNHLLKLNGNQLIDINQKTGKITIFQLISE